MFLLSATKNNLILSQGEMLTSGSVGIYQVKFGFNSAWNGLTKVASFKAGKTVVSVLLDDTGTCTIPWEVLSPENVKRDLSVGVCGMSGEEIVLPTVWKTIGSIQEGVSLSSDALPPTPGLVDQALQQVSAERAKAEAAAGRAEEAAERAENAGTGGGGAGGTAGTGNVWSAEIQTVKVLDQAEYEALEVKDDTTLYLIRG